jgi:hypothetical protein
VTALTLAGLVAVLGSPAPPLLEMVSPAPGSVVGLEGIEVLVRFDRGSRAAPETFRALLNGADVTDAFTTGENGAHAQLYDLLDGENRLRVEVFGRGWLCPERLAEQGREVRVLRRPPLDADRG